MVRIEPPPLIQGSPGTRLCRPLIAVEQDLNRVANADERCLACREGWPLEVRRVSPMPDGCNWRVGRCPARAYCPHDCEITSVIALFQALYALSTARPPANDC